MLRPLQINHPKQNGSVLLEALIAILIFSMGILAIVGLQANAFNSVGEAKYRLEASYLANQIVSTMWAEQKANMPLYAFSAGTTPATSHLARTWFNKVTNDLPGTTAFPPSIAVCPTDVLPVCTVPSCTTDDTGTRCFVTVSVRWKSPKEDISHQFVTNAYMNFNP
jgi:type IV pilus assembly protein PilV